VGGFFLLCLFTACERDKRTIIIIIIIIIIANDNPNGQPKWTTQMDNPNGQPKWTTQMDNPNGQPKWTTQMDTTQMKWTNPNPNEMDKP